MNRLKIALLFGGCSEEHDVSIKSAKEIADNIDTEKYEPIYIGITRSGVWKMCEKPCVDWDNENCRSAVLSPDKKMHGLLVMGNKGYQMQRIDAVFSALHGKSGEDGAIQGLFELSGIPYVGCDVQSSAVCMDKSLTYIVTQNAGFGTPEFLILNHGDIPDSNSLTYPVFVKPARSGSSFGVNKVNNEDELDAAIETARQYDSKVLIEQAVPGLEVGCAVLGNGTDLIVGEVDQISLSHGIFRIHQEDQPEKGSENAVVLVPANLSAEKRIKIQETAKAIYKALGCKGLSRIDMFLQEDGRIILNEVNTLPGFTSYSRYPRMMAAAGVTLSELIDHCITLALKG
ncbi:vancomycin/teicoplanin A-type resistance protein VanA [Clostridium argentinense CDC 2741]|uniref:D-alanine--D-alanine ligase n=1 Tax=Clostridium argentinense CDC 2741 TaxID=1418104 RepID=A0A0C1R4E9_9CLOT|nr:D-alanine--(R)-lactate ligase VanF [Clostridium argentinense]ARC86711.1 D-alanine--(R)-lactate ligase VanF [Clostridium argentinense]KIE45376.1 vancomycin/teicoplanin A-type resistance protein VanA [Clostridium argentinense CDC 2741]NFF38455.1 D-alanine--(R)-lactate ligase VanF [Clostridium argentinense]NFP49351.1 D-alanine--(R)-lactate ligase VanF [Clostridium argentinense]NFP71754.1 D-alanine--(R)-lactate ligase VanF [Clostridium argentinense]